MVFTKAMPSGNDSDSSSSSGTKRTTFRPPWVKEGPDPLPAPPAPWTLKTARRNSKKEEEKPENPLAGVQLRKTTVSTKEPQENGREKEVTFKRPQLKPVPQKEDAPPKKENKLPELKQLKPVPPKDDAPPKKENKLPETVKLRKPPPIQRTTTDRGDEDREIDRAAPALRNALVREESMRNIRRSSQSQSQAPAPPPMPPPAPKMPGSVDTQPLSDKQKERLEQLKNRPKTRPDWTAMLKEIEGNKKLKHVECNDRSQPLLPNVKATEHFLYESEKPNVHNVLLRQIESGIKLKSVKTNDRSKPMLEGLRKIRRQMTIEEQIQKSVSMASIAPEEIITDEADEMDDIDKVRDDLQSTKQMLALELRNKEAQERENKRLLARLQNLEAELEKERLKNKDSNGASKGNSNEVDEKLIKTLKQEAEQARKSSIDVERKFQQTAEQLDSAKQELEEAKKQNQLLEKRLQEALSGKRQSLSKDGALMNGQEIDEDLAMESEDEESDGEDTPEKKEKRLMRDIKHLRNKLRNFKNKEDNAKKERLALKDILKKHQQAMKDEKKKFKALQKEVDKMASLMKDTDEDEDDEEKEESEEEEEAEEESSESESEESESEEESEDESESESEDAPPEKIKANLEARCNRHEKVLNALKKGNYTMKTNAERLQDDLNKQKELTEGLQADLDSVLSELG